MLKLRPYQSEALDALNEHLRTKATNPCVVAATGCHQQGHPILMADGSVKKVELIVEGEYVMGNDSTPRKVIRLCRGSGNMYRITPRRGTPFVVNEDHVLSLVRTPRYRRGSGVGNGGAVDNVSVREYLTKSKTWKHIRKLYRTAVDFKCEYSLEIDPRILGLLLGDGCLLYNQASYCSSDEELLKEVYDYAVQKHGLSPRACNRNGSVSLMLSCGHKGKNKNGLIKALRSLGLLGCDSYHKFIPKKYLTANYKDRMDLFAGLIDTDGYIGHGIDYVTVSKQLSDDMSFLARSLGYSAHTSVKIAKCQSGASRVAYRTSISGDLSIIPMRRKFHLKKIYKRKQKKDHLKSGFSIENIGFGDYFGFELDGNHLYVDGFFMVHHNSGKSYMIAEAIRRWKEAYPPFRVCVLAHRKELVDQNAKELHGIDPSADIGIYAAGLGEHDTGHAITYASIDSIYNKAGCFLPFDVLIIDECHRIPLRGEGKYRRFITDCQQFNPNLRVIGFTATPYRLAGGPICHKNYILNEVCYETKIDELIRDGYLCPLRSKVSTEAPDLSSVKKSCGDYQQKSLGSAVRDASLVRRAVEDALAHLNSETRKCCVWFCVDVDHCQAVLNELRFHGESAAAVTGETDNATRDRLVEAFRAGQFRHLLNVNVFTEGFNVKQVDAVVMLRPTLSKALYVQMVGRGMRLHPSKTDCIVLDYGHNIETHGPIDAPYDGHVRVEVCAKCREVFARGIRKCPKCGWEIPKQAIEEREKAERERKMHEERAAQLAILGSTPTEYPVSSVMVSRHEKAGVASLCVTYRCGIQTFREWVCLNHEGYARTKAERWWRERFGEKADIPSVDEALQDMFLGYEIQKRTASITVVKRSKYNEIIGYKLKKEKANE